jgi:hypothetical protein
MIKIGVIQNVVGPMKFGVSVTEPNWNKFTLDPADTSKAFIPDLDRFLIGEWTASPVTVGKWYPIHRKSSAYWKDIFFRQGRPDLVIESERKQLLDMSDILGDRPHIIMDKEDLPPWDIRRDAWGFDGDGVVDRKFLTTAQEVVLALFWTIDWYIDTNDLANDPDGKKLARLISIASSHRFSHLRNNEIDGLVLRWRRSGDAPDCSSFETSDDAIPFDVRWFNENLAEVS